MPGNGIRRDIATVPDKKRALFKIIGDSIEWIPGNDIHDHIGKTAGAKARSLLHLNPDRLRATSRDTSSRQNRPDPVRACGTVKITSVDDRARALLDLVATGNESAYEELYRLLSRRVYAFVRRMIENPESADEIMMDTMYEVWRMAGRYRGDSRVTTWIFGIARNKVLMAMRSNHGAKHEDIDDFADVIDSEVPDGYALLAQKQTRELIQSCIQGLSEKHRECIHLTHFEEMSMAEIAAVLGIPEGTVKSRLSQARARLAACVSLKLQHAATS
jgi:RNA polymerase sigma-70 factor, ECF subfamily